MLGRCEHLSTTGLLRHKLDVRSLLLWRVVFFFARLIVVFESLLSLLTVEHGGMRVRVHSLWLAQRERLRGRWLIRDRLLRVLLV